MRAGFQSNSVTVLAIKHTIMGSNYGKIQKFCSFNSNIYKMRNNDKVSGIGSGSNDTVGTMRDHWKKSHQRNKRRMYHLNDKRNL